MKRSIALLISGGLTAMVALIGMAMLFVAFRPVEQPAQSTETPVVVNQPQSYVDVVGTTQATNQEMEATFQAREGVLTQGIADRQQTLTELDTTSQAHINELNAHIIELQSHIEQRNTNLQTVQANIEVLQQAVQSDDTTYQNELNTMIAAENQLTQELATATGQLEVAYQEITRQQQLAAQQAAAQQLAAQQAAAQQAAAAAANNNRSSGHHDDDHDDDGGHDHDDDDDDDDDDHDDDDDD